eukprot:5218112-Prymnesium_polylepis.1
MPPGGRPHARDHLAPPARTQRTHTCKTPVLCVHAPLTAGRLPSAPRGLGAAAAALYLFYKSIVVSPCCTDTRLKETLLRACGCSSSPSAGPSRVVAHGPQASSGSNLDQLCDHQKAWSSPFS